MPKTITYKTSQGIYEIPENEKDDFLKDFSDATEVESFVVGKDTFDIPLSDVDEFKSEVKDAKPLKKKEQAAGVTGTWQDSIPSQSEEMETMSTSKGEPVENFKIPDFNTPAPDTVIDKTQSLEPVDEQISGTPREGDFYGEDWLQTFGGGILKIPEAANQAMDWMHKIQSLNIAPSLKKRGVSDENIEIIEKAVKLFSLLDPASQLAKEGFDLLEKTKGYKNLNKIAEGLIEEGSHYDKGIIEYFKEGEIQKAVGAMGMSVAETLPQSALAMSLGPAGVTALGASAAQTKYDSLEESNIPEPIKMINASATGLLEAITEYMGSAQIGNAFKKILKEGGKEVVEKAAKNLAKNSLVRVYKKAGIYIAPLQEGLEEATNKLGENIVDKFTINPTQILMEGVGEAFAKGFSGGAAVTAVGASVKGVKDIGKKGKEETPPETEPKEPVLPSSAIVEDVKKEKLTSSATQEKEASKQPKKESKLPNNVIQTKEGLFELNEDQQSQREEMTEKYGKERADELIKDFIDVNDLKKYNVGVQETKTKENELQEEKTTEEVKPKEEVVETPKKEPKGKEIAFEFTGQQRFGKIIEENTDDRGKYLKVEDETGTIHRIRGNSIAHQKVTVDKAEIKKIKESLGYEPSKVSSAQMESKGKLEGGIEMPEMVEAVKKLIGNTPSINKYKKTLGRFYHNKKGSGIGLSSKLFKEGNETQTSFVIGHEMGHMVDYLPENTIRKGRILNRLYSIKEDVQDNIKNEKQLREELSKLSKIWNPYNEKTDAKYTTYRKRPSELYADAVSVFLNNPEMLKKEAPLFDKLFKEKFGEKANVQDVYNEILDLYEGGDVIENRIKNIERGYKEAESKRRRDLVKEKDKLNELEKFIKGFVSESHPLYTRMKDQKGITSELGDKNKLRNDLENLAFSNERQARFLVDTEKAVKDPIKEAGINPIDFDMLFQIERELTQRKDIANPQGRFRKHNEQIKKRIFSKYDDKQAKLIWDKKKEFHDAAFKVVKKFYEAGGISDDTWVNTIKPNRDVYATYSVVDYIDGSYSSPFIKQSTGTLKDIENPYVSTLYKLSAMIKETEKLNAIKNLTEVYNKHFPGEITHAKFKDGNWIVPKGKALLKTVDNGATVGLAVDPYIAEFFNKSHKEMDSATKLFKFFNKGFKPLVTTWNIGWAFYSNIARDRGRTLVNMNAILGGMKELNPANVTKALTEFYGNTKDSYKEAAKFVKGELTPLAREMVEGGVITHGFFGTYDAYANESMEPLFKKLGVLKGEKTAREKMSKVPIVNLGIKLLDALEFAGSVGEVSTKINAYKVFRKRMSPEAAAFYTRNYAGTPNYLERGNNTRTTNEIFAFSNVIAQSIRTDLEMSTKPSTAGGYWLHTAARIVIPQMIVSFAAAGLLGDELKRLYNKIPEYDKVNYLCIVTGKNQDDNPMYLRIPIPEFQRLVHALTYNITTGIADKELKNPTKTFDLFTDLFPSISPLWKVVGGWKAYLSGKNPYDEFYGSYVLDKYKDPEGWQSTKKMLKWSVSSIGGRPIIKLFDYDRTKGRTTEYVIKNIPVLNRALKVGNRGLVEQYLNKADDIRKEKTQLKIKQDKIIDKYVKKAIMNNLTVSDPETGIYNIDIMDEIMEKKLYKDILDIPNIKTGVKLRFNTKLNRGVNSAEDQLIDALTIVKDNDSKKEIINMYMDAYPEKNILDLLIFLKSNEIISDNLMKASFIYYNDNMLKTDNNEK